MSAVTPGPLRIVVLGLSITSSWGNGHATTYRGLLAALERRGHSLLFLERDVPWYRENRDLHRAEYCEIGLYSSLEELRSTYLQAVRQADVVIVGSYVPDGIAVSRWVLDHAQGLCGFYDIDTPVTLANLREGTCEYLAANILPRYDLYLSFTGGPTLGQIEREWHSPCARFLPCSVDPAAYYPDHEIPLTWTLGYLGTYSADRQPKLNELLLEPARILEDEPFIVAGPLYPARTDWPDNVTHLQHLAPAEHRTFYNSQRFTLNITRRDMVAAGYSPSVRLFEAAACATPIVSDYWPGLETIFKPGSEILIAGSAEEMIHALQTVSDDERTAIAMRARRRVLGEHTADRRALELESYLLERMDTRSEALLNTRVRGV